MLKRIFMSIILTTTLLSTPVLAERFAQVTTSGIFFKDKINIDVFDDPTIPGVSCYINLPDRAFKFDEQSDSSLACRQTGVVPHYKVVDGQKVSILVDKPNIFSKSKGIFFKKVRVDRFYDKKRNVLLYISYTKKAKGDNASSSVTLVSLFSK